MVKLNLIGQRYGKLKVIAEAPNRGKNTVWSCLCDCGTMRDVSRNSLRTGNTTSCGCVSLKAKTKHGMTNRLKNGKNQMPRIYRIWANMKFRCTNPKYKEFHYYGGRGIFVCDEWINDFEAFKEWSLNNGYAENLTIDRIDNDGSYTPNNCRWITMAEQNKNKRPGAKN